MSSIITDQTNGTCHIDATNDILVISNKVQGHNSPLPKTLLTKIPTLTAIWSSQREGEEDVTRNNTRENKYEQIDGAEDGSG